MKIINTKTGEILEDVKYIDTSLITIKINYLDNGVLRIKTEKDYHSFLQNWKEYEPPKGPLIKDEKIRKAVRAWAEANNFLDEIEVHSLTAGTRFSIENYDIEFLGYFIYDLETNKTYTIDELCGEEE